MKTFVHLLIGCILSQTAFAQNWLITGNSGTTPPGNFLGTIDNKALVIKTHNAERMRIDKTGNVGIGTTTPTSLLQVNGVVASSSGGYKFPDGSVQISASPWTKSGSVVYIPSGTDVGIGVVSPTNALDVCGTVRATDVLVQSGWCDYVFDKDYQLLPLKDVQQYINQNKHLPGIAPASEIQSQGLNVAETSTAMMKKIEELTLYVIDLQNQVNELKQDLSNAVH